MLRLPQILLAAACLAGAPLAQVATQDGIDFVGRSVGLTYAVEVGDDLHDLWVLDDAPLRGRRVLGDVRLLPIRLAGYALKDRLRVDHPSLEGSVDGTASIRLPGGGSLFRVGLPGATGILLVRDDADPRVLFSAPEDTDGSGVAEALHVAPDGRTAAVVARGPGGDDVYLLDLVGSTARLRPASPGRAWRH